jgi:hypothetical protein
VSALKPAQLADLLAKAEKVGTKVLAYLSIGEVHESDLDGFRTHFELVGRHLGRARDRWQDAAHRLDRFDGRLAEAAGRATDLDRRLPAPEVDGETGLTGTG